MLDPNDKTYETIDHFIWNFSNIGTTKPNTRKFRIHQDIQYGPKNEEGLNFIDAGSFFLSLKISWVKRYASDKLYDYSADIIDEKFGVEWSTRNQVLDWGTEAFTDIAKSSLPCIRSFFNAWLLFKTCFHNRSPDTHNILLHRPLFFN